VDGSPMAILWPTIRARGTRSLGLCALLIAAPAAAAPDGGDAVIARARAAEAGQLRQLAQAPVQLHTTGRFGDGKTTHIFESFRRIAYGGAGGVSETFEHGQVDGKPVTEDELRKAMGMKDQGNARGDIISWALAPLSSPDMEVTAVGPSPTGGYALRCRVTRDAVVAEVIVIVDERSGRKRTASIEMAGVKAKLADRLENVLTYADDGAPSAFRSSFHFKMGWIERSAEVRSERVRPPPAAGAGAR
jgi:hypothetical protein